MTSLKEAILEISDEKEYLYYQEKSAIADAMAVAMLYARKVRLQELNDKKENDSIAEEANEILELVKNSDFDTELFLTTRGQCGRATVKTARYLFSKHRELFEEIGVIDGAETSDSKLTNYRISHSFALVHGKSGKYYAISPANHLSNEVKIIFNDVDNPTTTILETDSLEEMVALIEQQEGGKWPSVDFIRECLTREHLELISKQNNGLCFARDF